MDEIDFNSKLSENEVENKTEVEDENEVTLRLTCLRMRLQDLQWIKLRIRLGQEFSLTKSRRCVSPDPNPKTSPHSTATLKHQGKAGAVCQVYADR